MIEILSFPKINTLGALPNIQLFGDAEADIVVLISHAVILCICNIWNSKVGSRLGVRGGRSIEKLRSINIPTGQLGDSSNKDSRHCWLIQNQSEWNFLFTRFLDRGLVADPFPRSTPPDAPLRLSGSLALAALLAPI
jgi:hypothetical protein